MSKTNDQRILLEDLRRFAKSAKNRFVHFVVVEIKDFICSSAAFLIEFHNFNHFLPMHLIGFVHFTLFCKQKTTANSAHKEGSSPGIDQ